MNQGDISTNIESEKLANSCKAPPENDMEWQFDRRIYLSKPIALSVKHTHKHTRKQINDCSWEPVQ